MTNRSWSAQQEAIFSFFKTGQGNLVVRARAGTGKTTTILEGITYAPEQKIVLCAFNKRIAKELQDKLKNPRAEAKTLHGIGCGYVLRAWPGSELEEDRGFRLALEAMGEGGTDVPGTAKKVANVVKRIAAMGKNMAPFGSQAQLEEIALDFDIGPDEDLEDQGYGLELCCKIAVKAMLLASRPNAYGQSTYDFDDMLFVPVRNRLVRGKYGMVVVDEAQDMNATQILLAQSLVKAGGRVVVVGDDRQAIYGFRGADSGSIDRLKTELKATELGLTITYRCPKVVVAEAQTIVPDYQAAPSAPEGILRAITEEALVSQVQPNDFVLSRKNAPLVGFCLAVLRAGKRARIEGRDIGAGIIKLVEKLKARDLVSLEKKLTEWEAKEARKLEAKLGKEKSASKIAQNKDMHATISALTEGLATVAELVARINQLFSDNGTNQVIFSSVHKAKGLEADRVFTIEDSFVIRHPGVDPTEEANIRYVALTRAKAELVFVQVKEEVA
jgi:DNA helicase-2/ATP-dependent DNA helicase PcrA